MHDIHRRVATVMSYVACGSIATAGAELLFFPVLRVTFPFVLDVRLLK